MLGNEDRNSSKSLPLSGRSANLPTSIPQSSDRKNIFQEEHDDDRSAEKDAPPPPLGVKLTGYRLVSITTVIFFGTVKTILIYKGQSIAPTTLDWVSGICLTVVLYWIGLYEGSNKWKWFFQVDLAPAIGYCIMRMVGGVVWLLFPYDYFFVFISLGSLLYSVVGNLLSCKFLHVPPNAVLALAIGIAFFVAGLWLVFRQHNRRIRVLVRGREWVVGFLNIYGTDTLPAERYGWWGVLGTIVGVFGGGIAVLLLPFAVDYVVIPRHC